MSAGQLPCPVVPVGTRGDQLLFLSLQGHLRTTTWQQLITESGLLRLCGGDERWLRATFPRCILMPDRAGGATPRVIGFDIGQAAVHLTVACHEAERRSLEASLATINRRPGRIGRRLRRLVSSLLHRGDSRDGHARA